MTNNRASRMLISLVLLMMGVLLLSVGFRPMPVDARAKLGSIVKPKPKPGQRVRKRIERRRTFPKIGVAANSGKELNESPSSSAIRKTFEDLIGKLRTELEELSDESEPLYGLELKRFDEPDKAMEYFLMKRLPEGETELPLERYLEAQVQMGRMPQFSTVEDRMLPSREDLRNAPEQQKLGTWTWLGPGNIGGRTRAIVINPQDANVIYAAGVSGGVWKSTNAGQSWTPMSDLLPNIPVSSLALDPADPATVYAGSGEGYSIGSVNNVNITGAHRGLGIFKSINAGANWSRLPGTDNQNFYYINKLAISKSDSKRIYAATETGVWRSLDSGSTWTRVLNPTVQSGQTITGGCLDLAIRTDQTTDHVFAACGTRVQSRIYRNTDAGGSGPWAEVFTEAGMGRTALAVSPSNQNIIYAVSTAFTGAFSNSLHAVFRSTNGGDQGTWTARVRNTDPNKLNAGILSIPPIVTALECRNGFSPGYSGQGFYDLAIAVDPADENRVWVAGIDLFRSDDGGANWGIAGYSYDLKPSGFAIGKTHPDQHVIVFHPSYNGTSNQQMFVGNDGGLYRTDNARAKVGTEPNAPCRPDASAVNWTLLNNNYGVTQFYQGTVRPDGKSYYGGTQDNGTVRGDDTGGPNKWSMILGGDGGYGHFDFRNPMTIYASSQGVSLRKSTDDGATFSPATLGLTSGGLFILPTLMDPSDSQRLYAGAVGGIFRSSNGASSWTNVTGTLPSAFSAPSAMAIAPTDANWLMAGSSTGAIARTSRILNFPAGTFTQTPIVITLTDNDPAQSNEIITRPRDGFVSWVAFDPTNKNIAYATYSTFGGSAHVWRTIDGGVTWSGIDGTDNGRLPDIPVHCIVVDPSNTSRLYIGTDLGVFVSTDGGNSWAVENTGFANVLTESLVINVADGVTTLYAFTHGRGAFKVIANLSGCNYLLGSSGQTIETIGGGASVNVTAAPGGCNWKAESNASWISVTSGATGSGNGTVGLRIDENKSFSPRAGTVNIAGRSFTVTQSGLPDSIAPIIEITTPAAVSNTSLGSINIQGTASDNVQVTQIAWRNDRGPSGVIPGLARWGIAGVPILTGRNVISVTARDDAGNTSNVATVTVNAVTSGVLVTVAGNGVLGSGVNNVPAIATPATLLYKLAFDRGGNLYFADNLTHRIRKVSPNGIITTIAGTGTAGGAGDGGPAAQAQLNQPTGVGVDGMGNIYITEAAGHRVRKVTVATGIISTVTGTGTAGFSGDDGPATSAQLNDPEGVAIDGDGNVYIADTLNQRIRKVSLDGKITTFAGSGNTLGDGGPANQARLTGPLDMTVDSRGNLLIADTGGNRIRKVDLTGTITTVAGNGVFGSSGDNGKATQASLGGPSAVAVNTEGSLLICDRLTNRIRLVNAADGVITTIAGGGPQGFSPDLVGAAGASLFFPQGVAFDPVGTPHFSDTFNFYIRKIVRGLSGDTDPPSVRITTPTASPTYSASDASLSISGTAADTSLVIQVRWSNDRGGSGVATGAADWTIPAIGLSSGQNVITVTAWDPSGNAGSAQLVVNHTPQQLMITLAGSGEIGTSGDGGPGTTAKLWGPRGVAIDTRGNLYVADALNHRVRKIDPQGRVTAFAGNGNLGSSGDGSPASEASMNLPSDVVVDASGSVYISDINLNLVRKVTSDGKITTVAGNGISGFGGEGGPGREASLSGPTGITVDTAGNLYIADALNGRIRKVSASDGKIMTVAGNGEFGFSGDGGAATEAALANPTDVAIDAAGNIYILDAANRRIRRINASDGKIATIAGTGQPGFAGDGGPARDAQFNFSAASLFTIDQSSNLFIADTGNQRIRKLTMNSGIVSTVAGSGILGGGSDGNPPTGVNLSAPAGVAVDGMGQLYVADTGNNRVLRTKSVAGVKTLGLGSAASFNPTAGLSADSIAVAFGTNLAPSTTSTNSLPLPLSLEDTTIKVRDNLGVERLAPLFYVSPNQINFLVPSGTVMGVATVLSANRQGETAIGVVNVSTVAPGLFTANANGQGVAAAVALRIKADGTRSFEPVARFDQSQTRFIPEPIDLGAETDQVFLIAFGSGFRFRSTLANVTATIGGTNVPVLYAGAQGDLAGVDQANLQLVRSLAGRGEIDVLLNVDGKPANAIRIAIK